MDCVIVSGDTLDTTPDLVVPCVADCTMVLWPMSPARMDHPFSFNATCCWVPHCEPVVSVPVHMVDWAPHSKEKLPTPRNCDSYWITAAAVGEPPESVIVGTLVYPVPGLVNVILVITPPDLVAVAVAPPPPPPEIVTVGVEEYPKPEFLIVNPATTSDVFLELFSNKSHASLSPPIFTSTSGCLFVSTQTSVGGLSVILPM